MNKLLVSAFVLLVVILVAICATAQPPELLNYQGRVTVDGTNFDGTGHFRFALVDESGTNTFWSNDGNSPPTTDVPLMVDKGLYSVLLGDTDLDGMSVALGPSVFANSEVYLRVWFSHDGSSFEQLAPDQRLVPVGYAMMAANVHSDGDIIGDRLLIGNNQTITSLRATIGGGGNNTAAGSYSVIGGGWNNFVTFGEITISGGRDNRIHSGWSTIGGGAGNIISNETPSVYSSIAGGRDNRAFGSYNSIGGGWNNQASNEFSTVSGGWYNIASGERTTIGGGRSNIVTGSDGTIGGGRENFVSGGSATVGGGWSNVVTANRATVAGGRQNSALALGATVGGGQDNEANGAESSVVGGTQNVASGTGATVGGGGFNRASGFVAVVAGGQTNVASGNYSAISGGIRNTAPGFVGTVAGGADNDASGSYSMVAGGTENVAGARAFAAGRRAHATHQGSFVWGDSHNGDVASSANNQVTFRASGGFRIFSNTGLSQGVALGAGDASWSSISDRDAKENFEAIDAVEILEQLAAVPVKAWTYKADPDQRRHIGPFAQDFHAAFGLGDDVTISTLDADGVLFAAVQGLHTEMKGQQSEVGSRIEQLEAENARLRAELEAIREHLGM